MRPTFAKVPKSVDLAGKLIEKNIMNRIEILKKAASKNGNSKIETDTLPQKDFGDESFPWSEDEPRQQMEELEDGSETMENFGNSPCEPTNLEELSSETQNASQPSQSSAIKKEEGILEVIENNTLDEKSFGLQQMRMGMWDMLVGLQKKTASPDSVNAFSKGCQTIINTIRLEIDVAKEYRNKEKEAKRFLGYEEE